MNVKKTQPTTNKDSIIERCLDENLFILLNSKEQNITVFKANECTSTPFLKGPELHIIP